VGGLVIDRLRRIPREGETIDLPALRIEVVQVEQGAIKTLRLIPRPALK
jgi:CBS domain containing-hemolysin-like protein